MILEIINSLQDVLNKAGLKTQVYGRLKSPYSVLKKMKRKEVCVTKLKDLIAIRIIVGCEDDCYKALYIMDNFDQFTLRRTKDYINNPKSNGYQSIHAIIQFRYSKRKGEIQIRSSEMHKVAELGRAGHLDYKREQDKYFEKIFNKNNKAIFHAANEMMFTFNWMEEQIVAYEQEIMRIWNNEVDEIFKWKTGAVVANSCDLGSG